jgi:HEAT repeat protein
MPITLNQVRRMLGSEEPNYGAIARLGPQILPHLMQLVAGANENLASKAASLAGMIEHAAAVEILRRAAQSRSAHVRIAAAGATRRLSHPAASGVIHTLLGDADKGVRKFAIKAAALRKNPALIARMRELSQNDPSPVNRELASRGISGELSEFP